MQGKKQGRNRKLSMEVIVLGLFPNTNKIIKNKPRSDSHLYISNNNGQDARNSHDHMVHLFKKFIEL